MDGCVVERFCMVTVEVLSLGKLGGPVSALRARVNRIWVSLSFFEWFGLVLN